MASELESLQEQLDQLKKDKEALASELKAGSNETNATAIQEAVLPHVPQFITNMIELANFSDSDSVKLNANKILIEWVVGGKLGAGAGSSDDEFRNLLASIKSKVYKDAVIPEKQGE